MTLSDVKDGGQFVIKSVLATGEIRRRLIDMGFIRGAQGKVLREALLRDPIELQLKGYKVSVRRAEAKQIVIEDQAL
ncbi:ferrous iron transport protein A [candidate division KSB1 bacterium]|nr:ferrous iron transport protein A [candidate division KSB1 bacterium]